MRIPQVAPAALTGVRVVDLTHFEAGTSCTESLAWLGADVIKIEPPGRGEGGRRASSDPEVDSYYFIVMNANKRSVTIDLRSEDGREVLRDLIASADVFVENFAPGKIEALGFDYESVRAINPRVIYGSIKGYGPGSPFESYPSFDHVAQAIGGSVAVTGQPDGLPVRPGPTLGDTGSGLHLVIGILAALYQRVATGEGQLVRVAMQEAVVNYCRVFYSEHMRTGQPAGRYGNTWAIPSAPSNIYACAPGGPNDYILLHTTRGGTKHWYKLLDLLGRQDLKDDPRFRSSTERAKYADEVDALIGAWTSQRTKHEAMRELGEAGVPAGAVLDTGELMNDEYLRSNGTFVEIDHTQHGKLVIPGWPVRMSQSHVPVTSAPALGEHTGEVLTEVLGLGTAEIERLRVSGAI